MTLVVTDLDQVPDFTGHMILCATCGSIFDATTPTYGELGQIARHFREHPKVVRRTGERLRGYKEGIAAAANAVADVPLYEDNTHRRGHHMVPTHTFQVRAILAINDV